MNIVFMGTPDFAVPCLEALIDSGHRIVGVFTQPDKPVGRKQVLTPPDVKVCAAKHDIPVYQPEKIKSSNAIEIINRLEPDVIIVVAYGKILPKEILTAAPYGCINVHASLLPLYRGAAPIQWSILNGDAQTGVSIMQMDEGLDTGDVLLVKKTDIDINETSAELFDRLSLIGAQALIEVLEAIQNGDIKPQPQPVGDYQYASMINKDMCPIDWRNNALHIHNQIRGLQTWPVAITKINGKNVKIHQSRLIDGHFDNIPGEIVDNNKRLIVCCGDKKALEITFLQPEGKKKMDAQSYLLGNNIELGKILGE
ncbi:MAG: methionyl-tRNA formyltransferase [Eubacterium sp.]